MDPASAAVAAGPAPLPDTDIELWSMRLLRSPDLALNCNRFVQLPPDTFGCF